MSLMKIKDLFHFEKGSLQSTKATPGVYDFITAAADWKTHNEYTHDCEALIFAAAASGSLGRTHYVNGKFISSDLCFIITPKDPDKYPIDLKFYHLIFLAFKDEIVRNTKSGTSKEAIGLNVFGSYDLPYFDFDKQVETREKFVRAQESTNKLAYELSHQLKLVNQLRKAFVWDAIRGKLVQQVSTDEPAYILLQKIKIEKDQLVKEKKITKQKAFKKISKDEIPFDIPNNWEWIRLGEIVFDQAYGTSTKANSSDDIPILRMGNITTNGDMLYSNLKYISKNNKDLPKLYLEIGDLIFNRTNSFELVGKCAVFNQETPYTLASYLIRVRFNNRTSPNYIANYINSSICRETQIEPHIVQQTGQANFNGTKLSNIICPVPPYSEQLRISAKLEEIKKFCDDLDSNIKESQKQNEQLLKQVLTEALGIKIHKAETQKKDSKAEQKKKTSKFDPNTTLMEIVEILKKHGKIHAEELWKMSKYPTDIDAFYAELKKQIEFSKTVKESKEKGYLELV
jgi:type I restriction enzyme S subunit